MNLNPIEMESETDKCESSSEESIADDHLRDPDFVLSSAFNSSDTLIDIEQAENGTANVVIDFIDFNQWDNVSLDTLPKRKSSSEVWNYFGILKNGDRVFTPMSKKIFCRPCFDEHKFKR